MDQLEVFTCHSPKALTPKLDRQPQLCAKKRAISCHLTRTDCMVKHALRAYYWVPDPVGRGWTVADEQIVTH
jgi:hypothetical protein